MWKLKPGEIVWLIPCCTRLCSGQPGSGTWPWTTQAMYPLLTPLWQTQTKLSTQTRFQLLRDFSSSPPAWRSMSLLGYVRRRVCGISQLLRGIRLIDVYRKAQCPEDGAKHCHLHPSNATDTRVSSFSNHFPLVPSHSSVSIPKGPIPSWKDSGSHWWSLELPFKPRMECLRKINFSVVYTTLS